ncbi:unnamed protein product [Didymodactylos carnosus]|uniref:EF-hand domain-containing protein n=1 Tax=Didymodactylos carnosus TaxID=1234261 RepID=A0A815YBU8_9BILA|nr:unnamed protein product [Didymodactylos carnosus]CAF1568861.1 unnamed protein product [Didymodactylos carnosus]CAF4256938.1 unnamed protein product [Didymodactylos carnosus]CAF4431563.1 unnamed protein product [Didymodactylos carnosus]
MADALFQQADTNKDNRLDLNEFRNLVSSSGQGGGSYGSSSFSSGGYGADASLAGLGGAGGGYSSYSSSSSFDSGAAGLGGGADLSGLAAGGGYGSSFESSSYSSGAGVDVAGLAGGAGGAYGAEYSAVSGGAGGLLQGGSYSTESTSVQRYATDAQGLFQDSNPQIIRKPAPGGGVTYKQNILVRFLQPPPVPPRIALYITHIKLRDQK